VASGGVKDRFQNHNHCVWICIHGVAFAYLQDRRVPVKINVIASGQRRMDAHYRSAEKEYRDIDQSASEVLHFTRHRVEQSAQRDYSLSLNNSGELLRTT